MPDPYHDEDDAITADRDAVERDLGAVPEGSEEAAMLLAEYQRLMAEHRRLAEEAMLNGRPLINEAQRAADLRDLKAILAKD